MIQSIISVAKRAKKTFVIQHNQSWCGLACMASIVKYYGGIAQQEQMVPNSGTTITGTTLLGLYHLAPTLGLDAEGYNADIEALKGVRDLSILHIVNEHNMQHYVVNYGWNGQYFIIGDPGKGILEIRAEELDRLWNSKALLLVKPSRNFSKHEAIRSHRWSIAKDLTRADRGVFGVALALGVLLAGLGLSIAIFSQKLVDVILPSGDLKKLVVSLIVVALLLIVKNGIGYLRGVLLIGQSKDFGNRMVSWFFGASLMLPKSFYDSLKTGDMVARLNDTRRLQQVINAIASSMIIDFLCLVAALILLLSYSTWLGLLSLSAILIFPTIVYKYNTRIKVYQQNVMSSSALSESCFVNTIQGVEAIKSTQTEAAQLERIKGAYGNYQEKSYELGLFSNKLGFIFQSVATLILLAIISLGAFGVVDKWLTLGELMAAISLASTVVGISASLSLSIVQFQEANVAFARLCDFIQGSKEDPHPLDHDSSFSIESLCLKNISFRYPGRSLLLEEVSVNVSRGELVCLFGEIGAGKSTVLQLLQRFYRCESGIVELNGADWEHISTPLLRSKIGVAPQDVKLLNATLIENICMKSDFESLQFAELICKEYGFDRFFNQLPQGLLTLVGEDGINLSGGQRQLLGLCRALFRQPDLLLLDEPTASLDNDAAKFVRNLLERLKTEKIIFVVTHMADVLLLADRTYQLTHKRIIEKDKYELIKEYNVFCEKVYTQQ